MAYGLWQEQETYLVKRPSTQLGLRRAQSSRTVSLPLDSARGPKPVEGSNREAYFASQDHQRLRTAKYEGRDTNDGGRT